MAKLCQSQNPLDISGIPSIIKRRERERVKGPVSLCSGLLSHFGHAIKPKASLASQSSAECSRMMSISKFDAKNFMPTTYTYTYE